MVLIVENIFPYFRTHTDDIVQVRGCVNHVAEWLRSDNPQLRVQARYIYFIWLQSVACAQNGRTWVVFVKVITFLGLLYGIEICAAINERFICKPMCLSRLFACNFFTINCKRVMESRPVLWVSLYTEVFVERSTRRR